MQCSNACLLWANSGHRAPNREWIANAVANRDGLVKPQVRCVLVALVDWLALNWPACALYRPHDPDQQDRADKPGNQVADPSP
jgi:hypothetical protein